MTLSNDELVIIYECLYTTVESQCCLGVEVNHLRRRVKSELKSRGATFHKGSAATSFPVDEKKPLRCQIPPRPLSRDAN